MTVIYRLVLLVIVLFSLPNYAVRVMDRHFLSAKLWSIFVESERLTNPKFNKNDHKEIFLDTVYKIILRPNLFGGDCSAYSFENYRKHKFFPDLLNDDLYQNGCSPYTDGKSKIAKSSNVAFNDLRAMKILGSVCGHFIDGKYKNKAHFYAMNLYRRAGVNLKDDFNEISLIKIYKVFYPSLNVVKSIISHFKKNLPSHYSNIEKLNLYSLLLCRSNKVMEL